MKKRALSVLLAVAMVSTLLAGCGKGGSDSAAEADASATGGNVVKIGVYEPASGDNGAGGKQETLGIQYANKVTPTVEIGGTEYTVEARSRVPADPVGTVGEYSKKICG